MCVCAWCEWREKEREEEKEKMHTYSLYPFADDVVRLERQCLTLQSELQREKKHATGLKADLQSLRPQVDTLSSQVS